MQLFFRCSLVAAALDAAGGTAPSDAQCAATASASADDCLPVGTMIDIYWGADAAWHPAAVTHCDSARQMHTIRYAADATVEKVKLSEQRIRLAGAKGDGALTPRPVVTDDIGLDPSAGPVVIAVPNMKNWHYHLAGAGPVTRCAQRCQFSNDMAHLNVAEAVIFLGDEELYPKRELKLPPKPAENPGVKYFGIIREALSVFPSKYWDKYDGRITYSTDTSEHGGNAITYGYSAPWTLARAKATPDFAERSGRPIVGFVSRQCHDVWPGTGDFRSWRTKLATDMAAMGKDVIASYGKCANNAKWPEGHHRDKSYVMTQHKFCLAVENHAEPDYVTEKIWDCLAAGSVPVYFGAPNVAEHVPGGNKSVIHVADFEDTRALVAHLMEVSRDEKMWNGYRQWIVAGTEDNPEWSALMEKTNMEQAKCNVCKYLRK
eukprot:TRINITY_DN24845_c0_g1_i2.p1 TRINITY_DN24845_c0_g1~~TRINITY_DN24845_c0_g1_i2.p1  ORF type:complete len:432 (-),score=62.12 TRINITY_DN24845_c0_g1_i2:9-1304(-)